MLPDRVSNPGPLTYESSALPIALRDSAPVIDVLLIRRRHEVEGISRLVLSLTRTCQYLILHTGCTNHLIEIYINHRWQPVVSLLVARQHNSVNQNRALKLITMHIKLRLCCFKATELMICAYYQVYVVINNIDGLTG